MGFGDSLLLSGIAKRINAMTNQRVCPVDAKWEPYWDALWDGIPYMQKEMTIDCAALRNGPSVRQYYSGMAGNRIIWRKWDIAPGEIRLTNEERKWAVEQFTMKDQHPRFLLINPSWKAAGGGGQNKDWGFKRWQEVAWALRDVLLVQVGKLGASPWLGGAVQIETPTFRHACAILERSVGYVGHEGGLHHAAAALGRPAVVVFGGYISPEITGYGIHKNLFAPSPEYPLGCGTVTPCAHCRSAMDQITVEEVVEAVREMLR